MISILISALLSLLILLCVGALVYCVSSPHNGGNDYNTDIHEAMQRYVARRQRAKEREAHGYRNEYYNANYNYINTSTNNDGRYNTTIVHETHW